MFCDCMGRELRRMRRIVEESESGSGKNSGKNLEGKVRLKEIEIMLRTRTKGWNGDQVRVGEDGSGHDVGDGEAKAGVSLSDAVKALKEALKREKVDVIVSDSQRENKGF